MGDDPATPVSGPSSPSPESGQSEERPKRRPRKPPEPRTLPRTEAGEKVGDLMRGKLAEMIDGLAFVEASRRRATAIDGPDYEAAFALIANPSKRQNVTVIVADVSAAVGAGLIGYAINVYSGGSKDLTQGHIALLSGACLTISGIILKYFAPRA